MARIDNELIAEARATHMIEFFGKYNGFTFASRGGAYRCNQHPSLVVKADCHSWYWHSQGVGGFGPIDYLVKVENMAFREAIETVLPMIPPDWLGVTIINDMPKRATPPKKKLILPEKSGLTLRLYDYLCNKRGIDSEIVTWLLRIEDLYEDRRGNVVFLGKDEDFNPRFASLRGTHGDCSFRGDCAGSDKRYGFNVDSAFGDSVHIFESPIDLLSHATLEKIKGGEWSHGCNSLSLAGTSDTAIPFFLKNNPSVDELIFCLDNDTAGIEAANHLAKKYADMGYVTSIKLPKGKDYNVDLLAYRQTQRKKERSHDVAR
jgi:hypothetical protein